MKKIITLSFIILAPFGLTACGEVVEVPPAYEGKIMTPNGYLPDVYPPSTFRMAACWTPGSICNKLVLIEKSDESVTESFDVFMPKNQLKMKFDLRITASVRDGKTDSILNKVAPQTTKAGTKFISFKRVYDVYAKPIIREAAQAVVVQYTIDQIASSRDAVNAELRARLSEVLGSVPVGIKTAGLSKVDYPDVITKRKEQAEERRIEIEQEESRKQVRLIQLQTELEAAKANRAIRREKAQAAAEENQIAAKSITPEYLAYKRLEVMDNMASSGSTVFVPFEALGTVGLSNKVFEKRSGK